jgi:hypothetical protein
MPPKDELTIRGEVTSLVDGSPCPPVKLCQFEMERGRTGFFRHRFFLIR